MSGSESSVLGGGMIETVRLGELILMIHGSQLPFVPPRDSLHNQSLDLRSILLTFFHGYVSRSIKK